MKSIQPLQIETQSIQSARITGCRSSSARQKGRARTVGSRCRRYAAVWWRLREDESGSVGTMEFVLLASIVCLGVIVGMAAYRDALVQEYGDLAASLLHVDQSFEIDRNGDGDTMDPGEKFTDSMPAYAALDAGGVDVSGIAAAESP